MPQIDNNQKLLERSIKKLDLRIAALTSTLKVGRTGRLTSDAINLRRAISMRTAISREFGVYYDAAETATDFRPVLKDVGKVLSDAGISKALTKGDATLIAAFSDDAFSEMSGLGQQYAAQISERVYTGVVVGDLLEDMTLDITQMLVGGTDKAGKPMTNHAKTIATTRYMEVDSVILAKKAEEFALEFFRYAGSLIQDSRKWCVSHKGQELSMEEIDRWEGQKWQGKKSGDPFVTRGGWNCRHRWLPIAEPEDSIDPEDADPEEINAKIEAATQDHKKYPFGTNKKENLATAQRMLKDHGFKSSTTVSKRTTGRSYVAIYNNQDGVITLNPKSSYWKDPKTSAKSAFDHGHLSTDSPHGVIYHEMAHGIYPAQDNWGSFAHQDLAGKVSKYAKRNPKEFVSETYAGLKTGKKYDEEVMFVFERYNGSFLEKLAKERK